MFQGRRNNYYLVGGIPTPLKNVSWDDDNSQYEGKNKKCSKPPTSSNCVSAEQLDVENMHPLEVAPWEPCGARIFRTSSATSAVLYHIYQLQRQLHHGIYPYPKTTLNIAHNMS
jgi:hypothetical protein